MCTCRLQREPDDWTPEPVAANESAHAPVERQRRILRRAHSASRGSHRRRGASVHYLRSTDRGNPRDAPRTLLRVRRARRVRVRRRIVDARCTRVRFGVVEVPGSVCSQCLTLRSLALGSRPSDSQCRLVPPVAYIRSEASERKLRTHGPAVWTDRFRSGSLETPERRVIREMDARRALSGVCHRRRAGCSARYGFD